MARIMTGFWRKYPVVNRYRYEKIRESLLTET